MRNDYLTSEIKKAANRNLKDRDYWLDRLSGKIEKVGFPYDVDCPESGEKNRAGSESGTGKVSISFPPETAGKLMKKCKGDYVLHIYLTAAAMLLLHKYTGAEDIIVGTPVYKQAVAEKLINRVVALRSALTDDMTMKELLLQVKQALSEAVEHQNYPIEMLPEQLDLLYGKEEGFPLFDTAVVLENIQDVAYLERLDCPVIFSFAANNGALEGMIYYKPALFNRAAMEGIANYFVRLLDQVLDNLDAAAAGFFEIPEKAKALAYLQRKRERETKSFTLPWNPCQEKLALLYSEILMRPEEEIGIDTDFFKMGGNSLQAGHLITRIHQEFDVRIPLKVMFTAPTIRELDVMITKAEKEKYAAIAAVEKREYYLLSSAQMRLFILDQQGSPNTAYNTTTAVKITGALNRDTLQLTFLSLFERHESLRTSFNWIKGEPVQRVYDPRDIEFKIEYYDVGPKTFGEGQETRPVGDAYMRPGSDVGARRAVPGELASGGQPHMCGEAFSRFAAHSRESIAGTLNGCTRRVPKTFGEGQETRPVGDAYMRPGADVGAQRAVPLEQEIARFIRPFDLSIAPLFRVGLIRIKDDEHLLLVDVHHIAADGTSVENLVREFIGFYDNKEVPRLRLQYKDFSLWEKEFFAGPVFQRQETFWLEKLSGELPRLQMPLDFQRPARKTFQGSNYAFAVPAEVAQRLYLLAREQDVTLNILFLSIYFLLLHLYSSQDDVIIASVVSGRNHAGLEDIIGMFANSLPLRNTIVPGQTFLEFLGSSKDRIIAVYDNQDYPFERMVDLLNITIDHSRNPIFDTMLAFHNEVDATAIPRAGMSGLELSPYPLTKDAAKFDFKLDVFIGVDEELACSLEYNTHLFKEETIRDFSRHLLQLIDEVTAEPGRSTAGIYLFSEEEKAVLAEKRKHNTHAKKNPVKLAVSATFTSEPIEDYTRWWGEQFGLNIEFAFAPYNQVFQELLNEDGLLAKNKGVNLLLTRFEDWIRDVDLPDEAKCGKLEKNFQDLIRIVKNKTTTSPYIVGLFPLPDLPPLSPLLKDYIRDLNTRWKKVVEETGNFYLLDFTSLAGQYRVGRVFDALMDKEGHAPFTQEYYAALGTRVARQVCAFINPPFKVIVLDCDNTLWQGVCGEDGPLGVKVDLPFLQLQRLLLRKLDEGLVLALCSKNNEADVWEVFDKNPGMILKKEHFVDWQINWRPKSGNLKQLAADLNLGSDSFIFIDDSPVECAEVMANCPEVLTLRLPADPAAFSAFLEHVWAWDKTAVTEEDRQRTQMYRADRERREIREQDISLNDYLGQLELKVAFNRMKPEQVSRVSQLTQRTNQFNLSTIRRSEEEIVALAEQPGSDCWVVEVSDRFGDYGLVGVVITTKRGQATLFIDTFLLSCRVLGRGVEDALLTCLKNYCGECGVGEIRAGYVPTPKNTPCRDFLERAWNKQRESEDRTVYILDAARLPGGPEYVELYYRQDLEKKCPGESKKDEDIYLDHIAVAAAGIEDSRSTYRSLGYTCGDVITDPLQKAKLVMCTKPGFDSIELVAAVDGGSPTASLVEKNGDIPYHLCYRVRDIDAMLNGLEQAGIAFEVVSEKKPAVLFEQRKVIFIDVFRVGLVEFLERSATAPNDVTKQFESQGKHFRAARFSSNSNLDGGEDVTPTGKEETRHNALRILVSESEPALKFYKFLGYTVTRNIKAELGLTITLGKKGAGDIELVVPTEGAENEQRFLDRNGPHPYRLVFYGMEPALDVTKAPPYCLFEDREAPDESREGDSPGAAGWEVYGLDRDNLYHKNYLLPLRYAAAGDLLALPVSKTGPTNFESGEYEAPRSKLEARLLETWQGLLRVEKIGINTSFFRAGGSSLKAVLMISQIEKGLGMTLSLREVFNHPTIKQLACYIEQSSIKRDFSTLKPVEKRDSYPLSSAQRRLYILDSLNPGDVTYNIPVVMRLEGEIDIRFMQEAFRRLIQRHESLRTSFRLVDGEPVQCIHHPGDIEFKIEYYEAGIREQERRGSARFCVPPPLNPDVGAERALPEPGVEVPSLGGVAAGRGGLGDPEPDHSASVNRFIRPFDLSRAPLLRVGLIKTSENEHVFIVDMHHIVSDGTSLILSVNEFTALYRENQARGLPAVPLQYKDFSLWQSSKDRKEILKRQEDYWLNRFKGEIPLLKIPTDYPRPEIANNKGSYLRFEIAGPAAEKLKMLSIRENATMFMVTLALFDILLFKLSGQEDIVVGTVTAGRRQRDLENIVGMFINTLPLRSCPRAAMSFIEFLKEVRESTLEAFDNEDYQFENLVDKLIKKRDAAHNPLFDVMFAFGQLDLVDIEQSVSAFTGSPGNGETGDTPDSSAKALKVKPFTRDAAVAKFDMIFSGGDAGEKLIFSINYRTELFKKETILRFSNYFKEIIEAVSVDETTLLKDISISHDLVTAEADVYRDRGSNFEF